MTNNGSFIDAHVHTLIIDFIIRLLCAQRKLPQKQCIDTTGLYLELIFTNRLGVDCFEILRHLFFAYGKTPFILIYLYVTNI